MTPHRWAAAPRTAVAKKQPKRKRTCWSKSVTRGGVTVRVYEAYPNSCLYRSIWVPPPPGAPAGTKGKEDKRSLGHKDRDRALDQAVELIKHLGTADAGVLQDEITLGVMLERYLASRKHAAKKERTQREDVVKLRRVVAFLGATRRAASLDEEAVLRFVEARRQGDPSLLNVWKGRDGKPKPVRDRAVQADLVALHTMLRWGCVTKNDHGKTLLSADPLRGVEFPREKNPRQPVINDDDLEALLAVADQVHPLLPAALIVANDLGRRTSAWRQLRWRDVLFGKELYGAIYWPGETDKNGIALLRPITAQVRDALLALRPVDAKPEDWVFPAPHDQSKAVGRRTFYGWLVDAYELAGLEPEPGSLWHALRRAWATRRKGYPVADIAAAGGWKDERSLRSYLKADPETVRKVVLEPTHRLRRDSS